MAARIHKVSLTDSWRAKIKASMLVNRLHDHALGQVEMTPTQIKAADILLKKVAPDLSQVQGAEPDGSHKVTQKIEMVIVDAQG